MQVPSTTILSNQAPIVVPPSHTSSQPSLNTAPLSQQIPVLPTPSPKGASRPSRSIINPKMILLVALAILIILGSIIGLYAFNTRTATNKANATATTLTDNNATAQAARATDQAVATAQDAFQATEQANAATQAADQALAQAQANDNATATSQAQANNDATATAQANIPPSQRYIYIGGLDIGGYCQSIGDAGSSLDGNTTWSWSCITSSGTHTNFDVSAVCRWQYSRNDVIAIAANFTNPSSLGCYTIPPNDIGGIINLSAYCQSLGDTNVSLDGTTSYDWHCDTPSGDHVGIDMMKACQWTYNRSDVTAIMVNLNDPGSWRCYTAS